MEEEHSWQQGIYPLTHGEPWIDLAFMVPLYHWAEHKVVSYFSNRKPRPQPPTPGADTVVNKDEP